MLESLPAPGGPPDDGHLSFPNCPTQPSLTHSPSLRKSDSAPFHLNFKLFPFVIDSATASFSADFASVPHRSPAGSACQDDDRLLCHCPPIFVFSVVSRICRQKASVPVPVSVASLPVPVSLSRTSIRSLRNVFASAGFQIGHRLRPRSRHNPGEDSVGFCFRVTSSWKSQQRIAHLWLSSCQPGERQLPPDANFAALWSPVRLCNLHITFPRRHTPHRVDALVQSD